MSPTYLPAVLAVVSQCVLYANGSVLNTNPWISKFSSKPKSNCVPHEDFATCTIQADPRAPYKLTGAVRFAQTDYCGAYSYLLVSVSLEGFPLSDPLTKHGYHVHQYGDLSDGCTSTGGHYNPFNMTHGAPFDQIRHVGDFGNIPAHDGIVKHYHRDRVASIFGRYSILGRAIVIHAGTDDLGRGGKPSSKENGNAGARLACCIIGYGEEWYAADQQ
ncbi:superoxide dismutase [Cu-Zn]-like [Haliotis rufescens]|uniref:superoxide dismutase [Cu-Zn]-like n=1 Tax=Haliotis rufescens TaxID=6454 RepID=UPI00201E7EE4|nr:superoxide dismutase [Cu-Zn]-like [Haliotis rufescens]